jgi:5-methylcytosine-specific restriction endonuclease McrA
VGGAEDDQRHEQELQMSEVNGPAPQTRARSSSLTARQALEMVERQQYRCAISGRPLTPENAALDHIVPVARGGQHAAENVWVVDAQVNAAKGTLTMEEFLAVCRDVANGPAAAPRR